MLFAGGAGMTRITLVFAAILMASCSSAGTQEDHMQAVRDLSEQIAQVHGVAMRISGIDAISALATLAAEIEDLDRRVSKLEGGK
jgi:cell division protein FtsB